MARKSLRCRMQILIIMNLWCKKHRRLSWFGERFRLLSVERWCARSAWHSGNTRTTWVTWFLLKWAKFTRRERVKCRKWSISAILPLASPASYTVLPCNRNERTTGCSSSIFRWGSSDLLLPSIFLWPYGHGTAWSLPLPAMWWYGSPAPKHPWQP